MDSPSDFVGLDFETYSPVDLNKHGLRRYIESPYFTPLVGGLVTWQAKVELDFIKARGHAMDVLLALVDDRVAKGVPFLVAHNAGFEQAVLEWLGVHVPPHLFIDSAVFARALGAGGGLEQAAPQLLGHPKDPKGAALIQEFCVPSKARREQGLVEFDTNLSLTAGWPDLIKYSVSDADQGLHLSRLAFARLGEPVFLRELEYSVLTQNMNNAGWPVDLESVLLMQQRYEQNLREIEATFRYDCSEPNLNFNSLKQLKEWCADRGIKASSFDKQHVESLIKRIEKKLDSGTVTTDKRRGYSEVLSLLYTKQELGGTGLKKLQVVLDTVSEDGRLRDQYFHVGASQSWRTTGRSVQMQNLKQLGPDLADMDTLKDPAWSWSNGALGSNMRQIFTSSHPQGQLLVGDFASIESRGLAYLAGAKWKTEAFRQGKDMYMVQAAEMFGIPYSQVTKQQRAPGKVGELSCGYGAGASAVESFANKMGVDLVAADPADIVAKWRATNPEAVQLWEKLNELMSAAMNDGMRRVALLTSGLYVAFTPVTTPDSLMLLTKGRSIQMSLECLGHVILTRVFHGCHFVGNDIHYFKPSKLKGGPLWSKTYTNPKTKQVEPYKLYGGKLTGILTQSFCREIFFSSLKKTVELLSSFPNHTVLGQFHDEIVVDYVPGGASLQTIQDYFKHSMEYPDIRSLLPEFPLVAEIKHDYRYTK